MAQDNDLIKEVVEIDDITEKRFESGRQAKVKAGGKTYTVYEKKQDGSTSAAWQSLERLGIGSVAQFCYVEKPGVISEGPNKGQAYTSRIVRIINEDIGNGMKNHQAQQTPRGTGPVASQSNPGRNYAREGYEKCLWNYWLGMTAAGIVLKSNWADDVWKVFKEIEADGAKRFFEFSPPATNIERVPTVPTVDPETPAHSDLGVLNSPPIGYRGVVPGDIGEAMVGVGTCTVCGTGGVMLNDGHDCIPF